MIAAIRRALAHSRPRRPLRDPQVDPRVPSLQGASAICDRTGVVIIRVSGPLGRELQRVFPSRPFNVRFWDGGSVAATVEEAPTFFVRRPAALAHFLSAPGTLGLGR